jgi:phage gp16-like protein
MLIDRRAMLAKVHVAKKQLGLDEATYRATVEAATGKRSAGDCTPAELERLLRRFQQLGFVAVQTPMSKAGRTAVKPHAKTIYALWGQCQRAGVIANGSLPALSAFCERQVGVSRPDWIAPEDAHKVIEALKVMLKRGRAPRKQPRRGQAASLADAPIPAAPDKQ